MLIVAVLVCLVSVRAIPQEAAKKAPTMASHLGSAYKLGIIKGLKFSPVTLAQAIRRALTNDVRLGTCGLAYYHGLLRSAIEGGRGLEKALSELADGSVFNGDDAEDELEELSDDIRDELDEAENNLEHGNDAEVLSGLMNLASFYEEDVQAKLERIGQEYSE